MDSRSLYITLLLIFFFGNTGVAQISFGAFAGEGITIDLSQNPTLDFGQLMQNETRTINLSDPDIAVIPITGVEYLDVLVTVDLPDFLENNGDQVAVNLNMAYANRGADNVLDAVTFTNSTIFRIRSRDDGPPRPPPTPDYDGYDPPMETAYIYIYGTITVGNVSAGLYTGDVMIYVEYD